MNILSRLKLYVQKIFFKGLNPMASNLKEYLDYYRTLDEPGYAVLVSGAWGSGKTYQVKEAIPEDERYYVSLFGLQTASEIHSEVFAAYDPSSSKYRDMFSAGAETAQKAGGIISLFGGLTEGIIQAKFRRELKPDRVLIFDDFERCGLSGQDLFGVLNTYVEQHGFRVVIIAHDGKIKDEFFPIKEKLIGQTLKVEPQIENAFDTFCKGVSILGAKKFIREHREVILTAFR